MQQGGFFVEYQNDPAKKGDAGAPVTDNVDVMAMKKQASPGQSGQAATKKLKELTDTLPRSALLLVPDRVRRQRIEKIFTEKFLGEGTKTGPARFSSEKLDASGVRRIKDELSSLSLFSPRKMVIVEDCQLLKAESQKALTELSEKVANDCLLLLAGAELPQTSALKKHFSSKDTLIELCALEGEELLRWTVKELKLAGINTTEPTVPQLLIEVSESTPERISANAQHLALFLDTDSASATDVLNLFARQISAGEYDFLDTLARGNVQKAEILLAQLFATGKNPFLLLSLLSRNFSTWFSIRSLLQSGCSEDDVRQSLSIPPWLFRKHLDSVRRFSAEKLSTIMKGILQVDSRLKNRSLGHESIFGELSRQNCVTGGGAA